MSEEWAWVRGTAEREQREAGQRDMAAAIAGYHNALASHALPPDLIAALVLQYHQLLMAVALEERRRERR